MTIHDERTRALARRALAVDYRPPSHGFEQRVLLAATSGGAGTVRPRLQPPMVLAGAVAPARPAPFAPPPHLVHRKTVPPRYHQVMAMNLRLDDDEAANLRRAASKAGISMQQAARIAIHEWVARAEGMTMAELMARPPLGGGSVPPGTAARLLHEARVESGRE